MIDIQELIAYWKEEDPVKYEDVVKYESIYGKFSDNFEDCEIYIKYISKFEHNLVYYTDIFEDMFDQKMLLQLVAASFSSDYELKTNDVGEVELIMHVQNNNDKMTRSLNDLFYEQINHLFEIYIHEQICFFIFIAENESDAADIQSEQKMQIDKFHQKVMPQLKQDIKTFELIKKLKKH